MPHTQASNGHDGCIMNESISVGDATTSTPLAIGRAEAVAPSTPLAGSKKLPSAIEYFRFFVLSGHAYTDLRPASTRCTDVRRTIHR